MNSQQRLRQHLVAQLEKMWDSNECLLAPEVDRVYWARPSEKGWGCCLRVTFKRCNGKPESYLQGGVFVELYQNPPEGFTTPAITVRKDGRLNLLYMVK